LQHFYQRAAQAVLPDDWQTLLDKLTDNLLIHGLALPADQVYNLLSEGIAQSAGLLNRVSRLVDIRHVIGVQHGTEVDQSRPLPNNRVHQWLDRLNPYIRWDADRFSFHDGDLEHIRLAATPASREDDSGLALAMIGQEDIKWVPTGDTSRMDAVWIVHGLPVTLLENLDEFQAQYENTQDFPTTEEFHLNPAWVNLPEITSPKAAPAPARAATGDTYRSWGASPGRGTR